VTSLRAASYRPRMVSDSSKGSPSRPSLPADRAFVVQLRGDTDPAAGEVVGRVEHVVSGRSIRFEDVMALVDFFRKAIADQREGEK
jgi:hypothetical protein